MPINILSVDWDYFYPDILAYDWQMSENVFIFYEFIWYLRYSGVNLFTKEKASEAFVADETYKTFFPTILRNTIFRNTELLCIVDSHSDIKHVFDALAGYAGEINVFNFDQHHDCGYSSVESNYLDCGNWVEHYRKQIDNYYLFYPSWRKDNEDKIKRDYEIIRDMHYDLDYDFPHFDIIFICRSSPWTPSWDDNKWIEFISYFEKHVFLWNTKISAEYVLKCRNFDLDQAINYEKMINELRISKG